jgi:hypothetical protein
MKCNINGLTHTFNEDQIIHMEGYAILNLPSQIYYLFSDPEVAGEKAREYWEDLAENDPEELAAVVGVKALVAWAKGKWYAAGTTSVQSLDCWFELWEEDPAQHWARYDGEEHEVFFDMNSERVNPDGSMKKYDEDEVNEKLEEVFGFIPKIAYRS